MIIFNNDNNDGDGDGYDDYDNDDFDKDHSQVMDSYVFSQRKFLNTHSVKFKYLFDLGQTVALGLLGQQVVIFT